MPVKIAICQSTSCSSAGSAALVRDIEELANGACPVEETLCLGRCGKGPNVELDYGKGKKKVVEGVQNFKKALALVEDEAECSVSKAAKNVGKIKFEARRLEDADKRNQTLQKAFSQLGDQAKAEASEPVLLSQLLIMRSGFSLKSDAKKAVQDAEKAAHLHPKWAFAKVALANAYEATKQYAEGISALEAALEIGTCIKEAAVNRQLTRLKRMLPEPEPAPAERNSDEMSAGTPVPTPTNNRISVLAMVKQITGENERPAPKPKAKAKGKPKARPKTSTSSVADDGTSAKQLHRGSSNHKVDGAKDGKTDLKSDDTKGALGSTAGAAKAAEQEWLIDSVSRLNHDSLCIVLQASGQVHVQDDWGDIWHVDVLREEFGEELRRSYTPLSSAEEYKQGIIKLLVKVYYTGKMTSYLAGLRPGSPLVVSRPLATVTLEGYEGVVMVAGGSSVTVAVQIFRALLAQNPFGVAFHLFLCNRTAEDVLCQDELEGLVREHPSFSLAHCISDGPVPTSSADKISDYRISWKSGRLSVEDLEKRTAPTMRGVVSGPAGLCTAVVRIWRHLGRERERLAVLDELPPEVAANAGGSRIISL